MTSFIRLKISFPRYSVQLVFLNILLLAVLLPSANIANAEPSIVQVLAYQAGEEDEEGQDEEDELINQGSGVVITADGRILTNNHLLAKVDKVVVQVEGKGLFEARILHRDPVNDLAILLIDASSLSAISLEQVSALPNDTLTIKGYWSLAEKKRQSFALFDKNKPKFEAAVIPRVLTAKGLVTGAEDNSMTLSTTVGRGSYGGGVFNQCGHLVGFVRPQLNKQSKDLWEVHVPLSTYAISSSSLLNIVSRYGIIPQVVSSPCLSPNNPADQTIAANKKKSDKEKKALAAKLKAERKKKEQAEKQAEDEKTLREQEEKKGQDLLDIVRDKDKAVGTLNESIGKALSENKLLQWVIAGVVLLALIIVILLMFKRKKDLRKAGQEIEAASASFADCRFEGKDSKGSPLAFMVLGRDLMQRDKGLLVGRNPDQVQVVIADDTISRVHACLSVENEHLYIEDLGSTGGTKVNKELLSNEKVAVITGDRLRLGDVELTVMINKG